MVALGLTEEEASEQDVDVKRRRAQNEWELSVVPSGPAVDRTQHVLFHFTCQKLEQPHSEET